MPIEDVSMLSAAELLQSSVSNTVFRAIAPANEYVVAIGAAGTHNTGKRPFISWGVRSTSVDRLPPVSRAREAVLVLVPALIVTLPLTGTAVSLNSVFVSGPLTAAMPLIATLGVPAIVTLPEIGWVVGQKVPDTGSRPLSSVGNLSLMPLSKIFPAAWRALVAGVASLSTTICKALVLLIVAVPISSVKMPVVALYAPPLPDCTGK